MNLIKSDPENNILIAEQAVVVGNVSLSEGVSIWYNTTLRGDTDSITIGKNSNVQDGTVIHTDAGYPVVIGEGVTIGHGAIIHGCKIGNNTLIGMGSIILSGAKIGNNCVIGAGALVTQGMEIPDNTMAFGSPAKIIRTLTDEEISGIKFSAEEYLRLSQLHFK